MTTRADIFAAIDRERAWQDEKRGTIEERDLPLLEYLDIIVGEFEEAWRSLNKGRIDDALREVLQLVAVGVAAIERHGLHEREELTT